MSVGIFIALLARTLRCGVKVAYSSDGCRPIGGTYARCKVLAWVRAPRIAIDDSHQHSDAQQDGDDGCHHCIVATGTPRTYGF